MEPSLPPKIGALAAAPHRFISRRPVLVLSQYNATRLQRVCTEMAQMCLPTQTVKPKGPERTNRPVRKPLQSWRRLSSLIALTLHGFRHPWEGDAARREPLGWWWPLRAVCVVSRGFDLAQRCLYLLHPFLISQ
eukprot:2294766-Pleurochrysis_carterae.AAC.1